MRMGMRLQVWLALMSTTQSLGASRLQEAADWPVEQLAAATLALRLGRSMVEPRLSVLRPAWTPPPLVGSIGGPTLEEWRSGTSDNTLTESDPKETTDWQLAKVRKGKHRQPNGVSKSVQQRAEERKEVVSLQGTIHEVRLLSPKVQALVNGEKKIAEFQARIQELQAGLHQVADYAGGPAYDIRATWCM